MIKTVTLLVLMIIYIAVFTGCNTVHGLGKDIEQLGQAMKQSSARN